MNRFKHGFGFLHRLQIIESQDVLALRFEIGVPLPIPQLPCLLEMLRTVHFDDKLRSRRMKIHDIRANRFLSVELYAENLLASQARPQQPFRVGHVGTQFSGGLFQVAAVT
jgi:hypothetical protein